MTQLRVFFCLFFLIFGLVESSSTEGAEKKKLLLLGHIPDNHPKGTHEYLPGLKALKTILDRIPELDVEVIDASGDWSEGPDLIRKADGVVFFLSEGGAWVSEDARRYDAFLELAQRGGGFSGFHWGIGAKSSDPIPAFQRLVGGCHGGEDRKYIRIKTDVKIVAKKSPIVIGMKDFLVDDEFYYQIKFVESEKPITPLVTADIKGTAHPVSWSWERPDSGRSFGFSGLHVHNRLLNKNYRHLLAQGIAWTMKVKIPKEGLDVSIDEKAVSIPEEKKKK